jgi:hypothetical protein
LFIGCGVEREQGELACAQTPYDRRALLGRPGCLADREERQDARLLERRRREIGNARRMLEREPCRHGELGERGRGLPEHAVGAGHAELQLVAARCGGVGRDVGDVQQLAGHPGFPSTGSSMPPAAADA